MFALGCIQSLSCHSGKCPSGVATQDPSRSARLDVADKSERVYHFHRNTVLALAHMLEAAGLKHPSELGPEHVIRRVSRYEVRPYSELFEFLGAGRIAGWPGRTAPVQKVLGPGPRRQLCAAGLHAQAAGDQAALSVGVTRAHWPLAAPAGQRWPASGCPCSRPQGD